MGEAGAFALSPMSAAHRSGSALVLQRQAAAADTSSPSPDDGDASAGQAGSRGFGAGKAARAGFGAASGGGARRSRRQQRGQGTATAQPDGGHSRGRRGSGLSAADRSPLGKAPDLEAIIARQRLGLPLAGRLREADVSRAWKRAAADHHPDRGGRLDAMQAVNTARDLLLGRGVA